MFALFSLLLFVACSPTVEPDPYTPNGGPDVSISPPGGKLTPGATVSLSSEAGATIYYTLDESLPDRNSRVYSKPISFWNSTAIIAVAYDKEGKRGVARKAFFQVDSLFPFAWADPAGATLSKAIQVTLQADETADIFYTTNGTDPTEKSPLFTKPLEITKDTELRFFAVDVTGNRSPIFKERYSFPPQVEVSPAPGLLRDTKVRISLKTNKPATIEFQLAHLQSGAWFRYQSPFQLSSDVDLRVRATSNPGGRSKEKAFSYALLSPFRWRGILPAVTDVQAVLTADLEGLDRPRTLLFRPSAVERLLPVGEAGWGVEPLLKRTQNVQWVRSWDLDGDGLQDVLVGNRDKSITWLQALSVNSLQADTTLVPAFSKKQWKGITPLDVDGDGQLDLLLLGEKTSDSLLLRRSGNRFVELKPFPFNLPAGTLTTLAGDWDSDARQDLLVLPGSTKTPLLLYRQKDRTLDRKELSVLSAIPGEKPIWTQAVRVDFDSDNRLDLILLGQRSDGSLVMAALRQLGQRFWKLQFSKVLGRGKVRDLAPVDLDQDGFPDLVITRDDGSTWLMKNFQGRQWYLTTESFQKEGQGWGALSLSELFGGLKALFFFGAKGGSLADWKARGRFLRIVVQGIRGNRSAIGAQVQLRVGTRVLLREVGPHSTGRDQHELLLPIGLGSTGSVGPLIVRWPDGQKREIPEPALGQTLIVSRQP